jgi:predicted amidohydrolase YtcJ
LHSDFTIAPMQPLLLAWIAANRVTEGGGVMGPEERLTLDQALRGITTNAAYVLGMEQEVGSIEPGKKADFTVLADDPYELDPMKLKDIPIAGTVFEGVAHPTAEATVGKSK